MMQHILLLEIEGQVRADESDDDVQYEKGSVRGQLSYFVGRKLLLGPISIKHGQADMCSNRTLFRVWRKSVKGVLSVR